MSVSLIIYIMVAILWYLILDKGISEAIEKDKEYFDTESIKINRTTLEIVKICLAFIWPISIIIMVISARRQK